jgi:hypothetical protein
MMFKRILPISLPLVLLLGAARMPNAPGGLASSQLDKPARVEAGLRVLLYNGERNGLLDLRFRTDSASAGDFRSKPGVWLRATGQGLNSSGAVTTREMRVDLRIKLRELPKVVFRPSENCTVFSPPGGTVDLFTVTRDPDTASVHAAIVRFAGQELAQFDLSPEWDALRLDECEVAGIVAQVYALLNGGAGGRGAEQCSPTFTECYNAAQDACHETGIKYFYYSCDPETGEAVCEFECWPPEQPDGSGT